LRSPTDREHECLAEQAHRWSGAKAVYAGGVQFPPVHLAEMPKGGHFAAMEQPEALAGEIQAFFRPLR
jgi:pimeloyl-ACP methyl ester carboxylesterase